jgi:hypothetical protein
VIWFWKRLVIPANPDLKKEIFDEAHLAKFSIHPGSTKIYQDLKENLWCTPTLVDTYVEMGRHSKVCFRM